METHPKSILLTIDVEDWFQVENFKPWIPYSTWDSRELRVEQNVSRLLDLFDTCSSTQNSRHPTHNPIRTTFFVLGWIAKRLPHMVREIHVRGHEVASHSYNHELCGNIKRSYLKEDLIKSKKILEDTLGSEILGYRAPSFSIDSDTLKIIEDCGYLYDSSYNSFSLHGRYGSLNLNGYRKHGIAIKLSDTFCELPISNLKLLPRENYNSNSETNVTGAKLKTKKLHIPLGGGAYFRLVPFPIFKIGVKSILRNERAYLFYMHPWEVDPDQPVVRNASRNFKFRHYTNIHKTVDKLKNLFESFANCEFTTCKAYIMNAGIHHAFYKTGELP